MKQSIISMRYTGVKNEVRFISLVASGFQVQVIVFDIQPYAIQINAYIYKV